MKKIELKQIIKNLITCGIWIINCEADYPDGDLKSLLKENTTFKDSDLLVYTTKNKDNDDYNDFLKLFKNQSLIKSYDDITILKMLSRFSIHTREKSEKFFDSINILAQRPSFEINDIFVDEIIPIIKINERFKIGFGVCEGEAIPENNGTLTIFDELTKSAYSIINYSFDTKNEDSWCCLYDEETTLKEISKIVDQFVDIDSIVESIQKYIPDFVII